MRQIVNPNTNTSLLRLARRALGYTFLAIGLLGAIFPVIPGWPALIPAILLLGRRDRTLRLAHLAARRALRRARAVRVGPMRRLAHWVSGQYLDLRRSITPRLIAAERALGW